MTTVEQVKGCLALLAMAAILAVSVWTCAGGPDEAFVAKSWCETQGSLVSIRATMYSQTWDQACMDLYKERYP